MEGAGDDDDDGDNDVCDDTFVEREGGKASGKCFTMTNLFACLIYSFSKVLIKQSLYVNPIDN